MMGVFVKGTAMDAVLCGVCYPFNTSSMRDTLSGPSKTESSPSHMFLMDGENCQSRVQDNIAYDTQICIQGSNIRRCQILEAGDDAAPQSDPNAPRSSPASKI